MYAWDEHPEPLWHRLGAYACEIVCAYNIFVELRVNYISAIRMFMRHDSLIDTLFQC